MISNTGRTDSTKVPTISFRSSHTAERWVERVGLVAVLGTLLVLLWGIWRGTRQPPGHKTGPNVLRSLAFYFLASVGYFGLCIRLWRPLPLALSHRGWPGILVATFCFTVNICLIMPRLNTAA